MHINPYVKWFSIISTKLYDSKCPQFKIHDPCWCWCVFRENPKIFIRFMFIDVENIGFYCLLISIGFHCRLPIHPFIELWNIMLIFVFKQPFVSLTLYPVSMSFLFLNTQNPIYLSSIKVYGSSFPDFKFTEMQTRPMNTFQ